jgi:uncharacterized repeat protein (TIGR03803 family)
MMTNREKSRFSITNLRTPAVAVLIVCALMAGAASAAQAQTFNVIHNFTGGSDGGAPYAGLTMDQVGNLYGTSAYGGSADDGTVFELAPRGSSWILIPLHQFRGRQGAGSDGAKPESRVVIGPDGGLYGTTVAGGQGTCNYRGMGCGTVFNLRSAATACKSALCPWTETVLYRFTGGGDGYQPGSGDLIFDQAGNVYDTTYEGGATNGGVVYELTPSNGGWTESVLYNFRADPDGSFPLSGVIFDRVGNLYGTTSLGGQEKKGEMGPSSN